MHPIPVFLVTLLTAVRLASQAGDLARMPTASGDAVRFVANHGQWATEARFVARTQDLTIGLEPGAFSVLLPGRDDSGHHGHLLRLAFAPQAGPRPRGIAPLPGQHHFLLGNEPSRWHTHVPAFAAVAYDESDGWSVVVRSSGRVVSYDVHARPGVAAQSIVFHCAGADRIERQGDELWLHTPLGTLRQSAPVAWQVDGSRRIPVTCSFTILDTERYAFSVPGQDPGLPLVIDPGLTFASLLGGDGFDDILAVRVDTGGRPVVAGTTQSFVFPTTPGAFRTAPSTPRELFVSKFATDGSGLLFSTLLGGSNDDSMTRHALALDAADRAVLCATSRSTDYPTTPGAFSTTNRGGDDAVLTFLTADGSGLFHSTYFGGSSQEFGNAVAPMPNGDVVIGGSTRSTDHPRVNALSSSLNGFSDGFVARFNTSFQLVYSTYLGGSDTDTVQRIVATPQHEPLVVGGTFSGNFPTTPGAFDRTFSGGDLFVTRIGVPGNLLFSTFLGGSNNDELGGVALAPDGSLYVVGNAGGLDFPTTPGTLQPAGGGAFVTRLRADGAALLFSTFLFVGANARAVAVDAFGGAIVGGDVDDPAFPTTRGAHDRQHSIPGVPSQDGFVTRLDPNGTQRRYSSYFGHTGNDRIFALAGDANGGVFAGGDTIATSATSQFPTTPGAFQTTIAGASDGFLAHFDLLPTGVQRFGAGTPGCAGVPLIDVSAQPFVGNAQFAWLCARAPQGTVGLVAFALAGLAQPLTIAGVPLWVDPAAGLQFQFVFSDAVGNAALPLPIPANAALVGLPLAAQFAFDDTCAPPGLATSAGLALVVQP